MGWLDGQVALVTGGGSGIGRAVVTRFIEEGARVGVVDRVAARMEPLRADLGETVVTMAGDVTQLADNKRAVATTVEGLRQAWISSSATPASSTASFPCSSFPRTSCPRPVMSCSR